MKIKAGKNNVFFKIAKINIIPLKKYKSSKNNNSNNSDNNINVTP